jgi:HAD superfamily hydrolase (TIGR01509 family)
MLGMPHTAKAIFFDVGNTLLFPDRERIYAPLYQHNIVPNPELLRSIECRTKAAFDALLQQAGAVDHGFWYMFYSYLFEELGLQQDGLRDTLVAATRVSSNWGAIRPGTREILQRIAKQYRLGVISNSDGKIAALLERYGIADCFLNITDSGLVGREKPHPAIFQAALRTMDVAPEDSLYVGDMYSVDYLGATGVGMQAMLFDVCGAYRKMNLPRVESLEELEGKLLNS